MPVVTEDLVAGHRLSEILGGFDITRIFRVTELVDPPQLQLIEAALATGVPLIGDVYDPAWPQAWCITKDVAPDGPNAARVTCTFSTQQNRSSWNQPDPVGNDGQDVKQISATTKGWRVWFDNQSNPMELTAPPSLDGLPPYMSEADRLYPIAQLVFERTEKSPPSQRARDAVGTVNSVTLGGGAWPAFSLLYADFDATSDDGGRTWRCTYTFNYDPLLHAHYDVYKGPDGKAPTDAVEQVWAVTFASDFSLLGLDFTDTQTPIS